MKPKETMPVRVGGVTLTVPVCVDEDTTLAIAEKVEARLKDIEEQSTRIDTQVFALQAAMTLAMDLHKAREAHHSDSEAFSEALEGITEALDGLLTGFGDLQQGPTGPPTSRPGPTLFSP